MAYGGLQELHRKFLEYLRTIEIALDPYPDTYQWLLEQEKMPHGVTNQDGYNGKLLADAFQRHVESGVKTTPISKEARQALFDAMTIQGKQDMTSTDTPRTNGNGKKNKTPEPVPPSTEQLAVESAARSFAKLQTDRDEMDRKLTTALQMCAVHKIEIEELRAQKAVAESRIASYQNERDDAVSNTATLQTLFTAVMALMRTFNIEHAPLVKNGEGGPKPT